MVAARVDARIPRLAEIKGQVGRDLERKMVRETKDKVVAALVDSYDVVISTELAVRQNELAAK
jgi:hypothetical protein